MFLCLVKKMRGGVGMTCLKVTVSLEVCNSIGLPLSLKFNFSMFEIFSQGHFHIILKTGSCFCGHKFFLNYLIEKPTFSFSLPGPLVFIKT